MMCGGPSQMKEADAEIQGYCDKIRQDLETKANRTFPHFKAVQYMSQVVAGTNYFVKVKVEDNPDGACVHLRIFQSLPHAGRTLELHSMLLDKTMTDTLDYF